MRKEHMSMKQKQNVFKMQRIRELLEIKNMRAKIKIQ